MSTVRVEHADCRAAVATLADASVDSVVTDPPYALVSIVKRFGADGAAPVNNAGTKSGRAGDPYARAAAGFMGKRWDTGEVAFDPAFWADVLRVLKPGGHVVAFGGTRTYHRLAVAIEDAGFEIRDQIGWLYGTGFPKSHDISKGIDKAAGVAFEARPASGVGFMGPDGPGGYNVTKNRLLKTGESTDAARAWQGWGTALKPAWEPIVLARKPLAKGFTVAENVLAHGTGAINVDGCRVEFASDGDKAAAAAAAQRLCHDEPGRTYGGIGKTGFTKPRESIAPYLEKIDKGRWPANIVHDGSDEVIAAFPETGAEKKERTATRGGSSWHGRESFGSPDKVGTWPADVGGSAARFFYSAKADKSDRHGSKHPTVKPVDLMAWLCRLVTPPGGTILDPFAGSGSTGMACLREGFDAILIEREAEYVADIRRRLAHVEGGDTPLFAGAK